MGNRIIRVEPSDRRPAGVPSRLEILERGPFSLERVAELSRGQTTLPDKHIREGVVVRPVKERFAPRSPT